MSARDLSIESGVSYPYIYQIEQQIHFPSKETISKLAYGLKIDCEVLVDESKELPKFENDYSIIGKNIRKILKKKNLSVEQLARKSGVSPNVIYGMLYNKGVPTLLVLEEIAAVLKISVNELTLGIIINHTTGIKRKLNKEENELIKIYRFAKDEGKKMILDKVREVACNKDLIKVIRNKELIK